MGFVGDDRIVSTDCRGWVVLPGRSNETFALRAFDDGAILLEPVGVVTDAQVEYDADPKLRDLLARAAVAPDVTRAYRRM